MANLNPDHFSKMQSNIIFFSNNMPKSMIFMNIGIGFQYIFDLELTIVNEKNPKMIT